MIYVYNYIYDLDKICFDIYFRYITLYMIYVIDL
jgi:hypothetical protein